MATMNPYLNFNGNTEEAFNFYKSVFGGEVLAIMRYKDTPHGDKMPPDAKEKIMHIALPIGKGNVLMGTDSLESLGQKLTKGDNFSLALETESKEETDRLYHALVAGGTPDAMMPLGDAFWGAYFGMLTDKYGVRWIINYTYPKA
jgi:PhnB protein